MKNQSSIAIGKVAAALLADLERHNFTPSLTYRTRAHKLNCFKAEDVKAAFKLTLAAHPDVDTSELRLRVMAIGKVRSKDAMNWQIDDLINFLQSWVDAGRMTQERGEEVSQEAITKIEPFTEPKVMYYRHNSEGPIYRVTEGKCYVSLLLDSGEWREVITAAEKALARIALGEYFECDAEGAPIYRDVLGLLPPEPKAEEWVYFQCLPASGWLSNIRRHRKLAESWEKAECLVNGEWEASSLSVGDVRCMRSLGSAKEIANPELPVQPTIKPFTEATDPETGLTYKVDDNGQIWVRQKGKEVFHAAPCIVKVIKAVIKLGLVKSDPSECEY